jgi:hypothetical protein
MLVAAHQAGMACWTCSDQGEKKALTRRLFLSLFFSCGSGCSNLASTIDKTRSAFKGLLDSITQVQHRMERQYGTTGWYRPFKVNAPYLVPQSSLVKPLHPLSRSYASPPPPPPQGGTINPPTKAPKSSIKPTTEAAAGAISKAWKPSFAILAPTFLFTHVTMAWALVPPVYFFLRTTNLSNTLLAGPQGAWFLSRRVPAFIPDTLVDSLVGGAPEKGHSSSQRPTMEELIERLARRGIRIIYNVSRSAFAGLKGGAGEENALAKAALRELRGGLGVKEEEVRDKADGLKDKIRGYTTRQAQSAVSDIQFGQIRDGVAAWVVVKVCTRLHTVHLGLRSHISCFSFSYPFEYLSHYS